MSTTDLGGVDGEGLFEGVRVPSPEVTIHIATAVEKIWHQCDGQVQILPFSFR